jgi:spore maturation protein CgeB
MKIVYFTHSLTSCWNHGNAHFLRGVLRELVHLGHEVSACQPSNGWSLANLLADHGKQALAPFQAAYPELRVVSYGADPDPAELLQGADLAIVHEWTEPALVAALGRYRKNHSGLRLLFHDTHHRAVSDPDAMRTYDLSGYDGVLAFGASLAEVYRSWGWGERVFIWHEAADIRHFRPPPVQARREGLVWIGNWGDGERTAEIESFLLAPAAAAGLDLDIYGVRYPASAERLLTRYGARYRGWLANAAVPATFARHFATVHVPRRYYASALPGIPTIRIFEALACGIPLVTAPWEDAERLFTPGRDYLVAADGAEMTRHLTRLRADPALRTDLARSGRASIEARHSCAHRAQELLAIAARLGHGHAEVAA